MDQQKPNSKRKLKLTLSIVGVSLVVLAVVLFVRSINGPAQGSIASVSQNQAAIRQTSLSSKKYDGRYVRFTYPAHYKIVPSQQSSGYLEIVSLDNTDHSGKYISIGVLREALSNDSGVNYRKAHPELYKQVAATSDRVVFDGTAEKSEKTGFLAHGGLVTTLSITANGSRDLSEDFNTIASTLEWKQ
jgi:hypothetical protein